MCVCVCVCVFVCVCVRVRVCLEKDVKEKPANSASLKNHEFGKLLSNVVYFDQLLGAARTQKLVETFCSAIFQPFLFISKLF